jgi:hypothetical protein
MHVPQYLAVGQASPSPRLPAKTEFIPQVCSDKMDLRFCVVHLLFRSANRSLHSTRRPLRPEFTPDIVCALSPIEHRNNDIPATLVRLPCLEPRSDYLSDDLDTTSATAIDAF